MKNKKVKLSLMVILLFASSYSVKNVMATENFAFKDKQENVDKSINNTVVNEYIQNYFMDNNSAKDGQDFMRLLIDTANDKFGYKENFSDSDDNSDNDDNGNNDDNSDNDDNIKDKDVYLGSREDFLSERRDTIDKVLEFFLKSFSDAVCKYNKSLNSGEKIENVNELLDESIIEGLIPLLIYIRFIVIKSKEDKFEILSEWNDIYPDLGKFFTWYNSPNEISIDIEEFKICSDLCEKLFNKFEKIYNEYIPAGEGQHFIGNCKNFRVIIDIINEMKVLAELIK